MEFVDAGQTFQLVYHRRWRILSFSPFLSPTVSFGLYIYLFFKTVKQFIFILPITLWYIVLNRKTLTYKLHESIEGNLISPF